MLPRLTSSWARCIDLGNLAELALRSGNVTQAATRQLDSLQLALALGLQQEISSAWIIAARIADGNSDHETAVWLQAAADATLEIHGLRLYPTDRALCDGVMERGQAELGRDRFTQLINEGRRARDDHVIARTRSGLIRNADANG
jgi:hypothetical protein